MMVLFLKTAIFTILVHSDNVSLKFAPGMCRAAPCPIGSDTTGQSQLTSLASIRLVHVLFYPLFGSLALHSPHSSDRLFPCQVSNTGPIQM